MVSRLPLTARPAHQEIAVSYLTRLAAMHDLPVENLWQQVSLPKSKGNATRRLDAGLLATVANQPQQRLERAILELFDDRTNWPCATNPSPAAGAATPATMADPCCTCSATTPASAPGTGSGSARPT